MVALQCVWIEPRAGGGGLRGNTDDPALCHPARPAGDRQVTLASGGGSRGNQMDFSRLPKCTVAGANFRSVARNLRHRYPRAALSATDVTAFRKIVRTA